MASAIARISLSVPNFSSSSKKFQTTRFRAELKSQQSNFDPAFVARVANRSVKNPAASTQIRFPFCIKFSADFSNNSVLPEPVGPTIKTC